MVKFTSSKTKEKDGGKINKMGKSKVRKICGFYVNEWHLTTMILPYIHKEIEKENTIITILQNGISENIEEILSKMNLNKKLQKSILNINWKSTKTLKYAVMKEKIENIIKDKKDINILINGEKEYIEIANEIIEKVINETNTQSQINILNCYDATKFSNVSEITSKHGFIINTAGIKETSKIEEQKNA